MNFDEDWRTLYDGREGATSFLRVPRPMVVCSGIPVSKIYQLISIQRGTEKGL